MKTYFKKTLTYKHAQFIQNIIVSKHLSNYIIPNNEKNKGIKISPITLFLKFKHNNF